MGFGFNSTDQDDYDYLKIWHTDTKQAPHGFEVEDGALDSAVTETSTDANMPSLISSDVLWVRVTNNGTTVSVKCATSEAGLARQRYLGGGLTWRAAGIGGGLRG